MPQPEIHHPEKIVPFLTVPQALEMGLAEEVGENIRYTELGIAFIEYQKYLASGGWLQ